jgi:hypothetical protein
VTWNTASLSIASVGEAIADRPIIRKVSRSPNATSIGFGLGLNARSGRPASDRTTLAAAHRPICIA